MDLPIDPLLPEICERLAKSSGLLLVAPPGAGKTTRVPRALLDRGFADHGEIVVLEPRRLAARMAARRVAEELGEEVGRTIGYTMRFEDASSAATKVRFVTEGTLTRKLVADPELPGVGCVLVDEAHERSLNADVALAMLRRLQLGARPDLKLCAMSATLDAEPMAKFLDAEIVRAEGRRFEVTIEHAPQKDDRPLESQVASAVRTLIAEGLDGDVLVFLPGALEIRRAGEALAAIARQEDLFIVPLHGSLSPAEQDRAVKKADRRKIVLSTNVAETSVTIDGVVAVIDSGLARIASHDPWSGLPTLRIAKIAKASAVQRAGRAGRTRPGRCLRLYTSGDFTARPSHEAPEVARADLAETVLELAGAGVVDPDRFGWFEAPPAASLGHARRLLERLGAIADGKLTATGKRMLRFPAHPRLARLVVEAERRGVGGEGATIAALLGERAIGIGKKNAQSRHGSDVTAMLDLFEEARSARFDPDRLRWMGIDAGRAAAVGRVEKQLGRLVDHRATDPRSRSVDKRAPRPASPEENERALGLAVLAGYPDRVGRLRLPAHATGRAAREVVFAIGGTAALAPESGVADTDLVVAVDVEERTEGRTRAAVVRVASATDLDALIELFADDIKDETEVIWNASSERTESVRRMTYDGLVLEEKRGGRPEPIAAAKVLAAAVRAKGLRSFTSDDALDAFLARVAFARVHAAELGLPAVDAASLDAELDTICEGATSFADLRESDFSARIRALLNHEQARGVDAIAPEHVMLSRGRRIRLTYPPDAAAPHAASRLQDFFGMKDGPKVARGAVPVVLELLAPNKRAVQVTTDLAGFWSRHYPSIAKELRRRYPRHAWPENPLEAPIEKR